MLAVRVLALVQRSLRPSILWLWTQVCLPLLVVARLGKWSLLRVIRGQRGTRCRFPRRLMLLLLLMMIHCRAGKYLFHSGLGDALAAKVCFRVKVAVFLQEVLLFLDQNKVFVGLAYVAELLGFKPV